MTKRRSAAKARSRSPKPSITPDQLDFLRDAQDALATAARTLRAMTGCFDSDGEPRADAADVAAGVRLGVQQIKRAADGLFSLGLNTWAETRAYPMLKRTWDAADIVLCALALLDAGKFPDGHGMCVCPIRGALLVTADRLNGIDSDVRKLAERAQAILARDMKRHPQKYQRKAVTAFRQPLTTPTSTRTPSRA